MNKEDKVKENHKRLIKQIREKLIRKAEPETSAMIVAKEKDVIIEIADKLIVMDAWFLHKFREEQEFREERNFAPDFTEENGFLLAHIIEIQAKRKRRE